MSKGEKALNLSTLGFHLQLDLKTRRNTMARSDFAWVNFDFQFNAQNPSATRTFNLEGNPLGSGNGYLLIQAFDVQGGNHRILINGRDLPSFDIPRQAGSNLWTTWMDRVPQNFLNSGENRITIRRVDPDDFTVANVLIQWREQG
ncbi:MAG: hypothetical protein KME20_26045 [Kaiparowitsia implicata GSE-PSE-MK54-09C]|nr:hypothetical protein [Kaiparowitsia implicata GSE-PSE-MK54-09C]